MAAGGMSSSAHPVDLASSYANLCVRAVQDFLHTIVVVDDRATYGDSDVITSLVEPSSGSESVEYLADQEDVGTGGASIDVAVLTDASADIGLTCAVIRPRVEEQHNGVLERRLAGAARRADVLVLDWQLNDEPDGEAALRILQDIAEADSHGQGRLRLVCFYTSHPDLDGVFESVSSRLSAKILSSSPLGSSSRWLDCGYMRVVIFAKSGGLTASIGTPAISVSENDLPQKLVEEFAVLTSGFVSNVAVASLAAVRSNAHRLLARFGSDLDHPFLSHRFYEGGPESEELIVRLVADELKSLLDAADVRRWVDPKAASLWAEAHIPDQLSFKSKKRERVLSKSEAIRAVADGGHYGRFNTVNHVNDGDKFDLGKEFGESLTEILIGDADRARLLDYDFARLTCVSRNDSLPFPGERSPILTEGTIVQGRSGADKIYLLCSMPLCDTVRVNEPRAFPFVPLKAVASDDRYNLVALSPKGERLFLAFSPGNHYDLVRCTFAGGEGGVVRSSRRTMGENGEKFVFYDTAGKPWIWVAEVRFQHAHRKLNELGAASSRVGLDEAHTLRSASSRQQSRSHG
ncbi:response regulator receiver domain [Kitasatospora cineracea]|uniref:response regulator receiver domain n=1 Tax=Kitasatospora cineracea TaxID=88074 RepID=UPI003409AA14